MTRLLSLSKYVLYASLFFFAFSPFFSFAQERAKHVGVKMNYVYSLDSALLLSQQTGKPIFVNCYAHWAIPCRGMDVQVFSDPQFAQWMDANFISLWLNTVETPEGRAIAEKYAVKRYAHYLFLDAKANLFHRIVGGSRLPEFQEKVAVALSPKNLQTMSMAYEKGNRDMSFLRDYIQTLTDAAYEQRRDSLVQYYMARLPREEWARDENWSIIAREMKSLSDSVSLYVEQHPPAFLSLAKKQEVKDKMFWLYYQEFYPYLMGGKAYDSAFMESLHQRMLKFGFSEDSELIRLYHMACLRSQGKTKAFLDYLSQEYRGLDPFMLNTLYQSLESYKAQNERDRAIVIDFLKAFIPKQDPQKTQRLKKTLHELENYRGLPFITASLDSVLAVARKEKKLIFVDVFAKWCGPCKKMLREVFPQVKVQDFLNAHFVSIKIDAEEGEGIAFAKKYGVSAYPSFLVLDHEAKLVHRFSGARDVAGFIDALSLALKHETSYAGAKDIYLSGQKTVEAEANYLYALFNNNELPNAEHRIDEFLSSLSLKERCQPRIWHLFFNLIQKPQSSSFQNFTEHYQSYEKLLGRDADKKLKRVMIPLISAYLSQEIPASEKSSVLHLIEKVDVPPLHFIQLAREYIIPLFSQGDTIALLEFYKSRVAQLSDAETRVQLDALTYLIFGEIAPGDKQKIVVYLQAEKEALQGKNAQMYDDLMSFFSSETN